MTTTETTRVLTANFRPQNSLLLPLNRMYSQVRIMELKKIAHIPGTALYFPYDFTSSSVQTDRRDRL